MRIWQKRAWLLSGLLAGTLPAAAGTASNILVTVEAAALADAVAPPLNRGAAPAFVAGVPGVTLRSQGDAAPQADLSIRGDPFSSSGLLLSGLALHNPQTEHFQSDLPVPCDVFTTPQLLTGLDQFLASSGHPAGSVALAIAPIDDVRRVEIGGGTGDQFTSLRFSRSDLTEDRVTVGESVFAEGASVDRTDGRDDSYLNRWSAGAQTQARTDAKQFDLLGAYGWRAFGARGFYGAPPAFASSEEISEALVAVAATFDDGAPDPSHIAGSWQRTDDRYWLDRTDHDLYANHAVSDVATIHGDTRQPLAQNLDLDLRLDADEEWLDGWYAGSFPSVGLGAHERGHVSLATVPQYAIGDVTFSAGGSLDAFSDDRPAWLPAAGIEWHPSAARRVTLSYVEAVREPSFTELDYNSPGSLGNSGLERQHTRTLELAWREKRSFAEGGLAFFAEDGHDMVDWAQFAPGGPWQATNLDPVRTYGLVADAAAPLARALDATFSYQALVRACDTELHASRYVLDYPEHTVRLGARVRLSDNLALACWQECAVYAENPARNGSSISLAANAEVRWRVWPQEGLEIAIGVVNPWSDRFEIYPGQPVAGPRAYASMKRTW